MRFGGAMAVLVMAVHGMAAANAQSEALLQPLAMGDHAPLAQIHGLPAPRGGALLEAGRTQTRLGVELANNYVRSDHDGEALIQDGESLRTDLAFDAGLGDWEIGVTLPWIQQGGGTLDGFIEGWHDTFGLPDGDRPDYPRDRIQYRYQRGNTVLLDFHDRESGIGDLQLAAAYQLWRDNESAIALAATVKLPTGDADRLTGDDATATDLTVAASTQRLFGSSLYGYVNAGMQWLETGDVLSDMQRDQIWHMSGGLAYPASNSVVLKLQIDLHQSFYRSDLTALGADSAFIVVGGSVQLAPHWLLDIGVGEDIHVDTAPDVTLQAAVRWAP